MKHELRGCAEDNLVYCKICKQELPRNAVNDYPCLEEAQMEIPPITVAVESAVHDALKAAVQLICDEHKIQVQSVQVEWMDISDHGGYRGIVRRLDLRTIKTYGA